MMTLQRYPPKSITMEPTLGKVKYFMAGSISGSPDGFNIPRTTNRACGRTTLVAANMMVFAAPDLVSTFLATVVALFVTGQIFRFVLLRGRLGVGGRNNKINQDEYEKE
jgi:hypothetical protein